MKYFKRILFLLAIIIPLLTTAQDNAKSTKAQKKTDKAKAKREAKARKAELKGKKFHYKIQDKATRKRMKKHRKRVNTHKPSQPGFFKRLFTRKQDISYYPVEWKFQKVQSGAFYS